MYKYIRLLQVWGKTIAYNSRKSGVAEFSPFTPIYLDLENLRRVHPSVSLGLELESFWATPMFSELSWGYTITMAPLCDSYFGVKYCCCVSKTDRTNC